MTWKDGYTPEDNSCYKGQWWNDEIHGKGELKRANGEFISGTWVNGQLEGEGTMIQYPGASPDVFFWRNGRQISQD